METYYKELDIMYDKQALIEESKVTEFAAFKSGFNNGSWFDEAPTSTTCSSLLKFQGQL